MDWRCKAAIELSNKNPTGHLGAQLVEIHVYNQTLPCISPNSFLFFSFFRHFELSGWLPLYTRPVTPVPHFPFPILRFQLPVLVTSCPWLV